MASNNNDAGMNHPGGGDAAYVIPAHSVSMGETGPPTGIRRKKNNCQTGLRVDTVPDQVGLDYVVMGLEVMATKRTA
ncbi:hypothetical protein LguiB_022725 [Lonicera macranthoides]